MVKRSDGRIALKWVLPRPAQTTKIDGTDRYYTFAPPRFNVWMEWVLPEDVDRLLAFKAKTCNCNNGTFRNAFEYANLLDVNLWENGDRYGKPENNYEEVPNG